MNDWNANDQEREDARTEARQQREALSAGAPHPLVQPAPQPWPCFDRTWCSQ